MFCKNCGKELDDSAKFCPACGTVQPDTQDGSNTKEVGENAAGKKQAMEAENGNKAERNEAAKPDSPKPGKKEPGGNVFSRAWNSPLFTKAAVKFGNILEILEGILLLIFSIVLFKEGGFWGIVLGILLFLGGAGNCITGISSLLSRRKGSDEVAVLDEASINKKKRNLCFGIAVIIIALVVIKNTGGGTYSVVKSISFDDMGTETIGELVDRNIKNPEWSQKKLDGDSKLVYVEGYCPAYRETVRIEFYYEKLDDGSHEVSLGGMYWPDSGEEYNTFETAMIWVTFYE